MKEQIEIFALLLVRCFDVNGLAVVFRWNFKEMKKNILLIVLLIYPVITLWAQPENSVFAVLKISYNTPGETPVMGGICGTAFLVKDSKVLTAYHVLNSINFIPNPGYRFVQFWLLRRGTPMVIPISVEFLQSMQDVESTIITLPGLLKCSLQVADTKARKDDIVENFGHLTNMPVTKAHWKNNILIIDDYNLAMSKSDAVGRIVEVRKISVISNDVRLNDIEVIQPSFEGIKGMSGGPLLCNNKIIGMMSFGLPPDSEIKHVAFAIAIDQIISGLK